MPPRKVAKVLPPLPPATSTFTYNTGFRYGMGDNPPQYGQIPIPIGTQGCLKDLNFVITGTLPSLRREEAKDLIEKYGGKVLSNISGKTDIVIRGCQEVGPKKLEDAKKKNIPIIDQEGLFKIISDSNPNQPKAEKAEEKEDESKGIQLSEKQFPISSLLTEKYRPRSLGDIIGNKGPINQLKDWLTNFSKKDKKIALISGKPGIGKSTSASLICNLCGYTVNEFNASDVRSKSALQEIFNTTDSLTFQPKEAKKLMNKTVLIFDEVDGMSSGDRGGIATLSSFAKTTKVPIICICNNINDKKVEPLLKVSLSVSFSEPPEDKIFERLKHISTEEGIEITDEQLQLIANESKGDIRYAINSLQYWTGSSYFFEKDVEITDNITATLKIFSEESTIDEKFNAFFCDYSAVPLFVEGNITFSNHHDLFEQLDNISIGDEIDTVMRSTNSWDLLNPECVVSCLIPSLYVDPESPITSLTLPKFYGFISKHDKLDRYRTEISSRLQNTCGITHDELYDCAGSLIINKLQTLKKKPEQLIGSLEEFQLTFDDLEHLDEFISLTPKSKKDKKDDSMKKVLKLYKQKHSDNQKKSTTLSDVRSDYMFVKTKEKKKKDDKKSKKKDDKKKEKKEKKKK
ncbi:differentiation specific element binding protein [Histomonas meleagridis]|uniref:differentiation specific element binding protein n=1 Tax=Histomonas meleagridis TaxID=135588 RepID=UPI0035597350|nr:differentiation specific element binding protein [Histomonas meleagridis]KAH0799221.1 differentiation specific element binding protein [Histomonas meleagridis]